MRSGRNLPPPPFCEHSLIPPNAGMRVQGTTTMQLLRTPARARQSAEESFRPAFPRPASIPQGRTRRAMTGLARRRFCRCRRSGDRVRHSAAHSHRRWPIGLTHRPEAAPRVVSKPPQASAARDCCRIGDRPRRRAVQLAPGLLLQLRLQACRQGNQVDLYCGHFLIKPLHRNAGDVDVHSAEHNRAAIQ